MTVFLEILLAAFASITLENVIFNSAVGTSTLIECAKKPRQMFSFGLFLSVFSILASIITFFVEPLISSDRILQRFIPSLYILSLGVVYVITLLFIWKVVNKKFKYLSRFVHLTAFNCASLGCLFMNDLSSGTLSDRVIFALSIGLGFMLATYLLSINYKRLVSSEVPIAFRGFPVTVLYIGIISMLIYACNM